MNDHPTPLTVRTSRGYRIQRELAHGTSLRYAKARANGYRGPVTRAEVAAMCVRKQRGQ